ncbi:hypothetical protein [Actinomadura sp. SCN-SB]|uniref:hypothetical protein n=1 Tax=Actinomadura sp. SCN-SB TaxID=3373092 RepID=UPI003750D88B
MAVIAVGGLVISGLTLAPSAAAAPPKEPIPPSTDPGGYHLGARQDGQQGSNSNGGDTGGSDGATGDPAGGDTSGEQPPETCQPALGDWLDVACQMLQRPDADADSAPAVTPGQLATTRWQQLPIPLPQVRTAPPRGTDGLVGLPQWFWIANWSARTARAQAGAVWAEVTARPTSMTIHPGAGLPSITCPGPGTAYDPARSAASQQSDCSYTYPQSSAAQPRGAYRVTVTVVWGGTWVGSDGSGGSLPPLSRSTSFALRIAEAQGLYG